MEIRTPFFNMFKLKVIAAIGIALLQLLRTARKFSGKIKNS